MAMHGLQVKQLGCEFIIDSLFDCQRFAQTLGRTICVPLTIGLIGTLGAGKTQWTRYFAVALGARENTVSSPTFVLVHRYDSQPPIYHLDAYRIGDVDELLELGIEEMFDEPAITIIEWADRFPAALPGDVLMIEIDPGVIAHRESMPAESVRANDHANPRTATDNTGLIEDTEARLIRMTAQGPVASRVLDLFVDSMKRLAQ